MGVVLEFRTNEKKTAEPRKGEGKKTAEILFFSGVRYARDQESIPKRASRRSGEALPQDMR